MNNFENIQEFSRTPEDNSRTTRCFSRIKDITRFDTTFKDNCWLSRTSGNLILTKKVDSYLFTKKEFCAAHKYSTKTAINASRLIKKIDHCYIYV